MEQDNISTRIKHFRIVRDIPYYISIGSEQDYSCATKPYLLDILLRHIGLEVQHILCTFRWDNLGLPSNLCSIPHDSEETHEYLLVMIPETGSWVKVDPTWDSRIQYPNLKASDWDGLSDTAIAVPVQHVWSPEESEKLIREEENMPPTLRDEYLSRNGLFFKAFNEWLSAMRS